MPDKAPTRVKTPKTAMKRSWKRSGLSPKISVSATTSFRIFDLSFTFLAEPAKNLSREPFCLRSIAVSPSS